MAARGGCTLCREEEAQFSLGIKIIREVLLRCLMICWYLGWGGSYPVTESFRIGADLKFEPCTIVGVCILVLKYVYSNIT